MLRKKNDTLCINLKKLRNERSLTQQNVADGISIKQTSYGDLENGKSKLYAARLWQLADFFGVSVGRFCGEKPDDSEQVKVLQQRIEELAAKLAQSELTVGIYKDLNMELEAKVKRKDRKIDELLARLRQLIGDRIFL